MNAIVLAGTGHRPPRLGLGYDSDSNRLLWKFACEQLEGLAPTTVVSGMAQGWDAALAHAAVSLGIPFIAAIPFEGQESKWPEDARKRYSLLLNRAKEVQIVCPGPYANWKFYERDKRMVDLAGMVLALLDSRPEKSGTRATVDYAFVKGVRTVNCWDDWIAYRGKIGQK